MKAILKLNNIGQIIGSQILNFNSGVVTLITGRTATGKSRIIKSIALALSFPMETDNLKNEGFNFGILKSADADYLSLVNTNKENAKVELQYEKEKIILNLDKNGSIDTNNPGNEKFLYSSLLVKNSRIHNYITRGRADFIWIVNEMSLAEDYELILFNINSELNELNTKKQEIKKNTGIIDEKIEKIKINKEKLKVLNEALEAKQLAIKNFPFDKKVIEEENNINNTLRVANDALEQGKDVLKKNEEEIIDLKKKFVNNEDVIKNNEKELDEKDIQARELGKIKVEKLQEEIIEIQKLKSKEEQEVARFETTKQLWETVRFEEGNRCPLCQSEGRITNETKQSKIDECDSNIKKFNAIIGTYTAKISKNLSEINEKSKGSNIKKRIKFLTTRNSELTRDSQKLKGEITQKKGRINSHKNTIDKFIQDCEELKEKLNKLQKKKEQNEEYKKLERERGSINQDIGKIKIQLEQDEETIKQVKSIEIFEKKIDDLAIANQVIKKIEYIFGKIIDHLELRITEQREGAAKNFNKSTKNLIRELRFDTFKEIYLDLDDYRLNIIDNNNDAQELSSVSGGEKAIISSLLQISAKETYLSEIPFLIGDEIILDLDPERSEIFLNYLKKIAKDKDWFIILTQITNEDLKISEI